MSSDNDDLRDLYQDMILDHGKRPRNFHTLDDATNHANGNNPMCGDRLTVFVKMDGSRIADISFVGQGCAISTASASIMTEIVKGRTLAEAKALFEYFHALCTNEAAPDTASVSEDDRDRLQALAGVKTFPMRVKCATLAWHAFNAAFEGALPQDPISTE